MNEASPKYALLGFAVLLGCLAWPFGEADGQPLDQSPSSLVKFLMRPNDVGTTFSCAIDYETRVSRAAAKALVSQGQTALPSVEQALDVLKKPGARYNVPPGLHWLLYAYAKIQGQSAFARLWDLNTDPELWPIKTETSQPIALALSLTSYMSDTLRLARTLRCLGPQPRDALNQLILAWEKDDREWFENALGQDATAALQALRKDRSWADVRGAFWSVGPRTTRQLGTDSSWREGFPCLRWS